MQMMHISCFSVSLVLRCSYKWLIKHQTNPKMLKGIKRFSSSLHIGYITLFHYNHHCAATPMNTGQGSIITLIHSFGITRLILTNSLRVQPKQLDMSMHMLHYKIIPSRENSSVKYHLIWFSSQIKQTSKKGSN